MNTDVLGRRFADFKSRFSQLFGSKNDGYDELDTLERPLVSAVDGDDASEGPDQQHGGEEETMVPQRVVSHVPSQHEELEELAVLSKDAAEILWEMVVMGTQGSDVEEMRERAEQLRAQLRGMLNDYQEGDETLMCRALEAFDSLNAALEGDGGGGVVEPENGRPAAVEEEEQQQVLQHDDGGVNNNQQQQEGEEKKEEEEVPPLISF